MIPKQIVFLVLSTINFQLLGTVRKRLGYLGKKTKLGVNFQVSPALIQSQ